MDIPRYKVNALRTHLRRIVERASYDRADTRTADAFRLAKEDIRYLDRVLNQKPQQNGIDKPL